MLTVERLKKTFQANGAQSQERIALLISDKADFKLKLEEKRRSLHIDKWNNQSGRLLQL
jgi:hypothetical protein